MSRWLVIALLAIVTSACYPQPDRCTSDPNLPDCQSARAVSQSTIAAANANTDATVRQAYMKATQDAVALHAQATQGAINTQATAAVVSFDATRSAMEIDALRNSLALTATLQVAQAKIVATNTALEGDAKVNAALVARDTAQVGQWVLFGVPTLMLVALAAWVIFYSRRMAASLAAAADSRANQIRYGYQNSRVAYRLVQPNGQIEFVPLDQILGHSDRYLNALNVPDMVKLAAVTDSDKRIKVVHISQHTSSFPALSVSEPALQLAADQTVKPVEPGTEFITVPTFAQCLKIWRPRLDQMMLGYSQSGPVYCGLEDLLSVGIVGRPKTGKSTILRFIYVQCILVGAQVVVWDLHRTIVGSLPGANALTRLPEIDASAANISAELDRRLEAEEYTAQPIMVLADEFPLLAPNSAAATATLNRIILEGRKVNLFSMVAGQGLPAELFGGSTPRDALSSRYVLHTTTRAARMAGLEKDSAPWVIDLKRGYAVVDGPVDPQILAIPNTTSEDVKSVLATSNQFETSFFATSATSPEVDSHFQPSGTEVAVEVGPEVAAEVASERHNQVRDLLRAKTPVSQIVRQVWGVGPGGRAYTDATAELTQIMSELVK